MNVPSDVFKMMQELNAHVNPFEGHLGASAAKALAEYTQSRSAGQKLLGEMERARELFGVPSGADSLREAAMRATGFGLSNDINAALGHSIFAAELAVARGALGCPPGYEASMALKNAFQVESTYVNEIEKFKKALQRDSLSASGLVALQSGLQNDVAKQFATGVAESQASAALAAAQAIRNPFADKISALGLEAQRPHLLMDAYQRATGWLDPLKDLQRLTSLSEIEKYKDLISATDPLQIYRDALEAAAKNPFGDLATDSVGRAFESLTRFAEEFGANSWDDADEADIASHDITSYRELAQTQLNVVTLSPATIEALVKAFIDAYQKLPNVRDKKIFATFVYPLLVAALFAWFNPYADFVVKQKLEAANHTTQKAVQETARNSGAPAHVLASYRFVTAQSLTVRVNGRIRSPTVGTLRFGQPVEILKKDGDWSLIHYSDSDSEVELQGWVLARYLRKFK